MIVIDDVIDCAAVRLVILSNVHRETKDYIVLP